MADRLDSAVADMLLQEFEARGTAIVARCEAEAARRARAGEPARAAFRDEFRRALRDLATLEREILMATAVAAEQTEKLYVERARSQ